GEESHSLSGKSSACSVCRDTLCPGKGGSCLVRLYCLTITPFLTYMDTVLALKALIMGIVEGLTEFLPISSTGHLILAGSLLNFTGEKVKVFEIVIQAGAIFAVCWEYRVKIGAVLSGLFSDAGARKFAFNIVIEFLPAAILG